MSQKGPIPFEARYTAGRGGDRHNMTMANKRGAGEANSTKKFCLPFSKMPKLNSEAPSRVVPLHSPPMSCFAYRIILNRTYFHNYSTMANKHFRRFETYSKTMSNQTCTTTWLLAMIGVLINMYFVKMRRKILLTICDRINKYNRSVPRK